MMNMKKMMMKTILSKKNGAKASAGYSTGLANG